jgi:hypothetical protein
MKKAPMARQTLNIPAVKIELSPYYSGTSEIRFFKKRFAGFRLRITSDSAKT